MIWVDVPQPGGKMERKLIWYLVYNVTNNGKAMHPVEEVDGIHTIETVDKPVRFVPEFILRDLESNKIYLDRVIPVAMAPIQMREDPNRRFYNSAEMMREIKVGETVLGRGHLGRRRPADRPLLRVREGSDQRLSVGRQPGGLQEGRSAERAPAGREDAEDQLLASRRRVPCPRGTRSGWA